MTARARRTIDDNPLVAPSALPYGAPPFDRITDEDYAPAVEHGMRGQRAEMDAIASDPAPPTFENTIVAMERSGQGLTRALRAFAVVTSSNTNDTLQAAQTTLAPALAAHSDAIHLDPRLFARIRAIHDDVSAAAGLSDEERFLIHRYYLDFVRAGALLDPAAQDRLRALNQEESTLSTEFQQKLLAATRAAAVVLDDPAELDGLSDAQRAMAADAAAARELPGRWVLSLQNTTQQAWLEALRRREVRERVYRAAATRCERGDANDTHALIQRLAHARAERAALLGYPTTAAYVLEDQMARTPEAAMTLLADVGVAAAANARRDAAALRTLAERNGQRDALAPWDWQHYAEQLRKAEYELDDAALRPYFALDRVLRDGVFHAAGRLYGLRFEERTDIPAHHPDVRVFEVFDDDGSPRALFYADFFKRDNKHGGAWMDILMDQSTLLGTKAIVYNVCNILAPPDGQPALLTFDEVSTLFHEFGHALHGMLSDVRYPTLSGTNVPRDFVEFPSQFNEHCALDPAVFANYARHHATGDPMPRELAERIVRARTFNQGFALTEYVGAAVLDMAWHTAPPSAPLDADALEAFERAALVRNGVHVAEVPPRYRSTYFAHIWDGGYEAGYYAYLWAEVLDHDAFAWFTEHGGLTRENGRRFADLVLSRGFTGDLAAMYRAFRGRDPRVEPLLAHRGLLAPASDA